jgi:ABC-type nitrate/sulfonate/bicarbonate transport system substrate-binding protein
MRKIYGGAYKFVLTIGCIVGLWTQIAMAEESKLEELLMLYPEANAAYWDINVAIELGYFREEGFEPKHIAFQSSPAAIQQLVSKGIHMAGASPESLINAVERGATNFGMLMAPTRKVDFTLNVAPNIKRIEDLKGKRIGVGALKGGETILTIDLLAKSGLKPSDYTFLVVGASPMKLIALEKGAVDAAIFLQPTGYFAESKGLPTLLDYAAIESYAYPVYAVGREWAHEAEHGKRFSRAVVKGQKWLADPKHRAQAIAIQQKYTKRDGKILNRVYDLYFGPGHIYAQDGRIELAGMHRLINIMVGQGELKSNQEPTKYMIPENDGGLSIHE